jgi:hypothetical protein
MKREIGSKAMLKGIITHLLFFYYYWERIVVFKNLIFLKKNFIYIFESYIDVKNYFFKKNIILIF